VDPEQQARQAEIRAAVWRTLHRLPDIYRQVLILRELEGLSYQEIAAATGLSLDNVRVTLHRARLTFRDLYGLQVIVEEGRLICGELNELLSAEMEVNWTGPPADGCSSTLLPARSASVPAGNS
jgi:hypothetical protein